jgi:hypothetical protein
MHNAFAPVEQWLVTLDEELGGIGDGLVLVAACETHIEDDAVKFVGAQHATTGVTDSFAQAFTDLRNADISQAALEEISLTHERFARVCGGLIADKRYARAQCRNQALNGGPVELGVGDTLEMVLDKAIDLFEFGSLALGIGA